VTCICVFRRSDGTFWADFSETFAKRHGEIICWHVVNTAGDHDALIREPGRWAPERVRALAERARDEMIAAAKAVHPPVVKQQVYRRLPHAPVEQSAKPGFWDFLRRVIHGR
jgi:hypothetical protein